METLPAKEERNYSTIKAEEASNKQTNITYPKDWTESTMLQSTCNTKQQSLNFIKSQTLKQETKSSSINPGKKKFTQHRKSKQTQTRKGNFFFTKTLLITELPKHIVYNENANTLTPNRHASKNINNIVHSQQHITLKS